MASEVVERTARAIRDKLGPLGDGRYYLTEEDGREAARAAITAMRDPTAIMLRDAYDVRVLGADLHDFEAHDCAPEIYRAMIDAALGDNDA